MIFFVCSIAFSLMILYIGYINRKHTSDMTNAENAELDVYYEMLGEPAPVQLRQLISAAKTLIRNFTKLSKHKEIAANLYDERIVSESYYRKLRELEEEYIIQKTIIENEAECIKPNSKDALFSEANKSLSTEQIQKERSKLFDEAEYLKKRDAIKQAVLSNLK